MRTPEHTPLQLVSRRVRRAFERSAATYDGSDALHFEVGRRLLEHLDPVRLDPKRILDLGAGTGVLAGELARRYRSSEVVALDFAFSMLREARRRAPRWFSRQRFVCAQAEQIPLPSSSVDLVWSNLALEWMSDPDRVLAELARVLRDGGLVMLSTLGPDTLGELREAWAEVDDVTHVHGFMDMHDLGDALVRAGFSDVVVDAERPTVLYRDLGQLARELKQMGASNAAAGARLALTGRGRLDAVRERYERHRREGRLPATFEIVYAHAWYKDKSRVEVSVSSLRRPGSGSS